MAGQESQARVSDDISKGSLIFGTHTGTGCEFCWTLHRPWHHKSTSTSPGFKNEGYGACARQELSAVPTALQPPPDWLEPDLQSQPPRSRP